MISQLVSGDMMRRELRYMSEANGGAAVRIGTDAQAGFSVRDDDGTPRLIALTDMHRKRVLDIATAGRLSVPSAAFEELAAYVMSVGLSVDGVEDRCGLVRNADGQLHSIFDLPDELHLSAPFSFLGAYNIRLPLRLRSSRDFVLIGATITREPELIEIDGDADFSECRMGVLPDGAVFGRNLVLSRSTATAIPQRITVKRWLRISSTGIETIPSSARVGCLDAENSALRDIPPGFNIPGDLVVSGSWIRRLSGVRIGGGLFIERMQGIQIDGDCEVGGYVYVDGDIGSTLPHRLESRLFRRNPFGYERSTPQEHVVDVYYPIIEKARNGGR